MEETEEYEIIEEDLFTKLAKVIVLYDANEKFLALSQNYTSAEIYLLHKKNSDKKKLCEVEVLDDINDLKLNPNRLNILLVGTQFQIELFIIPEVSKEEIIKTPRFVFDKNKMGFQSSIFNPFNSHTIASSCLDHSIQIWSVSRQIINTISCKNIIKIMKWTINGEFLGFIDSRSQIKIYNNNNKRIIFNLDFKENHINFEFYGNNNILVQTKDKNTIYAYVFGLGLKEEVEIKEKQDCRILFEEKYNHILVSNLCYIIQKTIKNQERISLYDGLNNNVFNHDCSLNHPKVIKTADSRISFKILDKDDYNNFKLVTIKDLYEDKPIKEDKDEKSSSSSFNSFDTNSEDLEEEYFFNCPNKFIGMPQNL